MRPLFLASWFLARASSLAAEKTLYTSSSSHDAAIIVVMGNTVVKPLRPMPCRASLHHWNWGIPNRGIAGDESIISFTFSSSVSRPSKSSARCSAVSFGFWYGSVCAMSADVASVSKDVKNSCFMFFCFFI